MNISSGIMPADLRKENQKAVLKAFRDQDMLTAAELAEKTGISRQTVKKCIEYYLERNVLQFCGKGKSSHVGGKRPDLYCLSKEVCFVSILLHYHEISVNMRDITYTEIGTWSSGYLEIENLAAIWNFVEKIATEKIGDQLLKKVIAVYLVAPLAYDKDGRLDVATPFPQWPSSDYGTSLVYPLEKIFPCAGSVHVNSDGRCAAAAILKQHNELWDDHMLVTFYTSYGIGGGLARNDKILFGVNDHFGGWGHLIIDPKDQELCTCGNHGCLERLVSRSRMRQRLGQQKNLYEKSCLADVPIDQVTYELLFAGSARGDSLCRNEVMHYAGVFSIAIRNIMLTTDVDCIYFQGDFGKADKVFQEELLKQVLEFKYARRLPLEIHYDTKDLSEQETVGATYLMIQEYLENVDQFIG